MARSETETWKNLGEAKIWVKKTGIRGELLDELVNARGTLHISPEDRQFNSEMAADPKFDVFKNGMLTPVKLIDGAEDAEEVRSNPNTISEGEMKEMFTMHYKSFEQKLAAINSGVTLERLLKVGEEEDATVKQIAKVRARLEEVSPPAYVEVNRVG